MNSKEQLVSGFEATGERDCKRTCEKCARNFPTLIKFKKHVCLFNCRHCSCSFELFDKLQEHAQCHKKFKFYICQDCERKRREMGKPLLPYIAPVCDTCTFDSDICYHLVKQYCYCKDCGCWFGEMILPDSKEPASTPIQNKALMLLLAFLAFIALLTFLYK